MNPVFAEGFFRRPSSGLTFTLFRGGVAGGNLALGCRGSRLLAKESVRDIGIFRQLGLLPLPHVQFWETENSRRLDRSHRGGHRRDISCLDASDVRIVNALKTLPANYPTMLVQN